MLLRCLPLLPPSAAASLRSSLRCLSFIPHPYAASAHLGRSLYAAQRSLHFSAPASGRARGTAAAPSAMGKNVYAVVTGRRPGLYTSWDQCLLQVKGYPGNRYKGFASEQEAVQYLREHGVDVAASGVAAAGQGPSLSHAAEAASAAAADNEAGAGRTAAGSAGPGAAATRKRRAPSSSSTGVAAKRRQPAGAAAAAGQLGGSAGGAAPLKPTERVLRLEFDGASKRNPGPAGFGAVLYDDATNVEVARMCQYMGDHHTNNQAEYAGLIAGLAAALELGCSRIKVQGDSTLIIRQVLGEWRVKNEGLQPYHAAATALRRRFASFEAKQVLREFNKVADALSNQAIDDYRSGVNRQLWTLDSTVAAGQVAAGQAAPGRAGGAAAAGAAGGGAADEG